MSITYRNAPRGADPEALPSKTYFERTNERQTEGLAEVSVPLFLNGKITDFGRALRTISKRNENFGENADMPTGTVAKGARLSYARTSVALTALFRAGLIEFVKNGPDRPIQMTLFGRRKMDEVDYGTEPSVYVTATVTKPTLRAESWLRAELDQHPDANIQHLQASTGPSFGILVAALVYMDDQTKVLR